MVEDTLKEAVFYQSLPDGSARCLLCPQTCLLKAGESGRCRGRRNVEGKIYATNYGYCTGVALDPIEKKPLYHYHPGSRIVSLGANSCNLQCFFCQNFDISQQESPTRFIAPQELAEIVHANCPAGMQQVAFTYTEPLTWYEYIVDFAQTAPEIEIVLVTNGYVNPEPLRRLLPFIKAVNIDLKSMDPQFYAKHCGGSLEPVLHTIRSNWQGGVHLELTNLLIPGLNDSVTEVDDFIDFVADLNVDIPVHFSAYHPAYQADFPPTPASTVLRACEQAAKRLNNVYAGNILSGQYQKTHCPACGEQVVTARRAQIGIDRLGCCVYCGHHIYGRF